MGRHTLPAELICRPRAQVDRGPRDSPGTLSVRILHEYDGTNIAWRSIRCITALAADDEPMARIKSLLKLDVPGVCRGRRLPDPTDANGGPRRVSGWYVRRIGSSHNKEPGRRLGPQFCVGPRSQCTRVLTLVDLANIWPCQRVTEGLIVDEVEDKQ